MGSLSGGTDLCTGFLGPSPLVPVWSGEISCRMLGAKVEAFDEAGRSVVGREGELVITAPMPSMPVAFWGDLEGERLREAYFSTYPGVWRHGDWLTITERGSCIVTGRSDATLKRGGVRIGTSEFYGIVEALPEVADSLVVHLEDAAGGPGELLLFVVPRDGRPIDDDLRRRIGAALRDELSPRHVPDAILEVAGVPRTLSGKKLEVPVKRILLGLPPEAAASKDSLADPKALEPFVALAAERRRGGGAGDAAEFALPCLLALAFLLAGCAGVLQSPPTPGPRGVPRHRRAARAVRGRGPQLDRRATPAATTRRSARPRSASRPRAWTRRHRSCCGSTSSATARPGSGGSPDVDACAAAWAVDPATFELLQVSPYVLAGPGTVAAAVRRRRPEGDPGGAGNGG